MGAAGQENQFDSIYLFVFSYRGDTTSTAGFLHSPNYDAFDVTYSSFKPGSFNQSVFEHPCQVESISKPSGGFDASEFARHLDMDGDSRIFVPKMKMEVIVVVFFFFFFFN